MSKPPFEQVVREHGPTVLRVCRAVLGYHEAEDAWSETFLAAMRAYPTLKAGIKVEAWLVTIAKRKAIDQHRVTGRTPVPVDLLPEGALQDDVLQEQPFSDDNDGELAAALQLLPLRQREAIAYHYLVGLPYREVAEILGNSEAAARRSASDGMQKLRLHYRQSSPQVVHHNV